MGHNKQKTKKSLYKKDRFQSFIYVFNEKILKSPGKNELS